MIQNPHTEAQPGRAERPVKPVAGSQAVYRAIAVLRGVARHNDSGITAMPLSEEIGLTLATTHRLLQVLVSEQMLTMDPYSKKYHLGLELYQMGSAALDFRVAGLLESHLTHLRDVTRETVFLFIRSGKDSLCLQRIDGDFPIRALTLTSGSRRPLGVGSGSLALLAGLPDDVVDRILASNLSLLNDYFETSRDEMWSLVKKTRGAGFARNDGRIRDGVRGIGISLGPEGRPPIAAVSVATSGERMAPDREASLVKALREEFASVDWSLLNLDNFT